MSAYLQPARTLPRGVIDACRELAAHLRDRHTALYRVTANATEALLADEKDAARAEDLGQIDTFLFEEEKVLDAALDALAQGAWDLPAEWAARREGDTSFWLRNDPLRRSAWQLVEGAARLGQAIASATPELGASDLSDAVDRYVARGAAVDHAHRHLEQRRVSLLFWHAAFPELERLRERLDDMRRACL